MIKDNFALTGALTISLNNKVVQKTENVVVDTGKTWVASLMGTVSGTGVDGIAEMGVGTSGTTAAAGDGNTPLEAVVYTAVDTPTISDTSVTYVASFAAGIGPVAGIEEAGLFTTAGTMLARTDFDVINKGTSDTMTITWTITVS
jgi:hypothetical protein